MTPGALVLVTAGRYWLCHAVVEAVLAEHGTHGFARLRFYGRTALLTRPGLHWDTGLPQPAEDLVPVQALSVVGRAA